jgi:hypothetical protein
LGILVRVYPTRGPHNQPQCHLPKVRRWRALPRKPGQLHDWTGNSTELDIHVLYVQSIWSQCFITIKKKGAGIVECHRKTGTWLSAASLMICNYARVRLQCISHNDNQTFLTGTLELGSHRPSLHGDLGLQARPWSGVNHLHIASPRAPQMVLETSAKYRLIMVAALRKCP